MMADLMRWAWWHVRRLDWGMVAAIAIPVGMISAVSALVWYVTTMPIEARYNCAYMQRSVASFEMCLASESCLYEPNDLYHHHDRVRLIQVHCQGEQE